MFNIEQEVMDAYQRIHFYIRETPLDYSLALTELIGAPVYLKCENLQYTGAFKARGAFSKLLSLSPKEREQGVVTASSGNHGAGVALGLYTLNIPGVVCVPENASPTKVENIRNYRVPIEFHGTDTMQTELFAIDYAKKHHLIYVSPYNDLQVIGGQGTIAYEILHQLKKVDAVFVPVGGGGLISGIAGYFKAVAPHTKIIGCLPEHSPVMAECVKAGHIIEMDILPTISDATAGGLEPNTITFDICRELVDQFILVSEKEIKAAIILMLQKQHLLVEGASGVALAALIKEAAQFKGQNVVVVLSGANISLEVLKQVLQTGPS
jgi:threonine dehydratase